MLNRRGFFRLAAGALVAASAPSFAEQAPVIYADGIHCDTDGVEALIRGDVVRFANPEIASKVSCRDGDGIRYVDFGGVQLHIKRTIEIVGRRDRPVHLSNMIIVGYVSALTGRPLKRQA